MTLATLPFFDEWCCMYTAVLLRVDESLWCCTPSAAMASSARSGYEQPTR